MQELQQTSQAVPAKPSDRDASRQGFQSPHKLIPAFSEARDELGAYIERFERVATDQGWPRDRWGLSLILCLTGEALTVVGRMSAEDATDFAKLKSTLLQRYRYTEEGYRVKFREAKPENGKTGHQFVGRLLSSHGGSSSSRTVCEVVPAVAARSAFRRRVIATDEGRVRLNFRNARPPPYEVCFLEAENSWYDGRL
ncbi:hypothetical protein HPB50_024148 [Hyalomma asiaticum]|uniref:Uncharacterized protein n=1 Tax=Hyalomma asiaticum TaxID=266040 RepID=A0ACB7TNN7_HYAAI|nr:hypothetical protein HPB50_024148 [Hyalomma asiaticum]